MAPHTTASHQLILGIDIAKDSFCACLLSIDGEERKPVAAFPMTATGIQKLLAWIETPQNTKVFFEPTGVYGKRLLETLTGKVASLHQVNAALIAGARTSMTQTKTDPADARAIAKAGFKLSTTDRHLLPRTAIVWDEKAEAVTLWLAEYERVSAAAAALKNRLKGLLLHPAEAADEVRQRIARELQVLKADLKDIRKRIQIMLEEGYEEAALLTSIPGIGNLTAAAIIAKVGDIGRFAGTGALKGYLGLYPRRRQSGNYEAPSRMAKHGSTLVRHMLWNCARSAARCNPVCRALFERLIAKGKHAVQAYGAVCRKLVQIIFGILKNKTPFNPNFGGNS